MEGTRRSSDSRIERSWYELMGAFGDANLYQTLAYDMARYGRRSVVHMVVRRDGVVVAAAQVEGDSSARCTNGIAYTRWGPMWRWLDGTESAEVFRQAIRALRNELSRRRGLVVRLYPMAFRGRDEGLTERFSRKKATSRMRMGDLTDVVIDLERYTWRVESGT